jgi:hypothetical protein
MGNADTLATQLSEIFGSRLKMVAAFAADANTCAVVETLTVDDLDKCAALSTGWKRRGLEPPLLIVEQELGRSLDAFPLEFNEIISTRRVIAGKDFFSGLSLPTEDLRRSCEVQARGHLVHLREGYIEAAGDPHAVDRLVAASSVPFRALLANVARLDKSSVDDVMKKLQLSYVSHGFSDALRAAERLVDYVDRWGRA